LIENVFTLYNPSSYPNSNTNPNSNPNPNPKAQLCFRTDEMTSLIKRNDTVHKLYKCWLD